jgi:uncharacterized membrane protein
LAHLRHHDAIEVTFVLSLLAKAALAVFQLVAGFALLVLPANAATRLIGFMARNELAEDPTDPIAQIVNSWFTSVDPQASHFYVVYLLGHGAIHAIVVLSLLLKWRIAYPFSLTSLIAFVAYQLWHYTQSPDIMLLALSAIDVFVIVIVILEHRRTASRSS